VARDQQPYLHNLVSSVRAPALALSTADGQIRPGSASGVYHSDRRLLDEFVLRVDGVEPAPVTHGVAAAHEAWFLSIARALGDEIPDPTVAIERRRAVGSDGLRETFALQNRSTVDVRTAIALRCSGDLSAMSVVKAGRAAATRRPRVEETTHGVSWSDEQTRVVVTADPAPHSHEPGGVLRWNVEVPAGATWEVAVDVRCQSTLPALFDAPGETRPPWSCPVVRAGDHRLARLVERSLADLDGLLLSDPLVPKDRFAGAGSPWFLTLFGRDSLWTARFLLPTGTELAASTLRTLARRQGSAVDAERDEEPGKILHELRHADLGAALPPVYYGTVDATPLWICLLADAWRWGLPDDDVEPLIAHLERALVWMRDYGDADGDGFLEYVPHAARGLSNQGWKDSHDSVQWFDGALAESPIALCEVQAYAYEAARKGADLLETFGRAGADEWREWATQLRKRFRDAFWVERAGESYPAIALDRNKQRVDTVSSNIGHLLGTGILDDEETALIAARLGQPDMNSGWGLRTMTAASPRYNPLSYHGGSVWPHDTAITISGLAATGHDDIAASLAQGLVAAAEAFEFRLPELYGGHARDDGIGPVPYPAACRPQAWAAATAVYVTAALLGLQPDVPAGRLAIRPVREMPFGELDIEGFVVGHTPIRIRHYPRHEPATTVEGLPAGVTLQLVSGHQPF
jgi:glycogen debranching enzyme